MALMVCRSCGTRYAAGLFSCPGCGNDAAVFGVPDSEAEAGPDVAAPVAEVAATEPEASAPEEVTPEEPEAGSEEPTAEDGKDETGPVKSKPRGGARK